MTVHLVHLLQYILYPLLHGIIIGVATGQQVEFCFCHLHQHSGETGYLKLLAKLEFVVSFLFIIFTTQLGIEFFCRDLVFLQQVPVRPHHP